MKRSIFLSAILLLFAVNCMARELQVPINPVTPDILNKISESTVLIRSFEEDLAPKVNELEKIYETYRVTCVEGSQDDGCVEIRNQYRAAYREILSSKADNFAVLNKILFSAAQDLGHSINEKTRQKDFRELYEDLNRRVEQSEKIEALSVKLAAFIEALGKQVSPSLLEYSLHTQADLISAINHLDYLEPLIRFQIVFLDMVQEDTSAILLTEQDEEDPGYLIKTKTRQREFRKIYEDLKKIDSPPKIHGPLSSRLSEYSNLATNDLEAWLSQRLVFDDMVQEDIPVVEPVSEHCPIPGGYSIEAAIENAQRTLATCPEKLEEVFAALLEVSAHRPRPENAILIQDMLSELIEQHRISEDYSKRLYQQYFSISFVSIPEVRIQGLSGEVGIIREALNKELGMKKVGMINCSEDRASYREAEREYERIISIMENLILNGEFLTSR